MSRSLDCLDADDPRLTPDHVRTVPSPDGGNDVVLAGAVHDHPSSVHRVRTLVGAVDPDVVALELPALAVPLYGAYADGEWDGRGGEMSAAIGAAPDADVVGIDAPSRRFLSALAGIARDEGATRTELRRVLRGLRTVTRRSLACRLAAPLVRYLGIDPGVDAPTPHGCDFDDEPARQARDEARQISRSVALLAALDDGGAMGLRDRAREKAMTDALADLRRDGAVVAVVGRDHLDPVAERLAERSD